MIDRNLTLVLEQLAEREGKKGDLNTIRIMHDQYGKDLKRLTFRILDELLIKEQRSGFAAKSQPMGSPELTTLLLTEIFLKSVFVCATETVFFISLVKHLQVHDVLQVIDLKAFDFWRLLNSFLKFDPQMPKTLNDHFRQTEIKIVSEEAWRYGSPVVQFIKEVMTTAQDETKQKNNEKSMQSCNLFFKRVLHLASQRIIELGDLLGLSEDVQEKVWSIQKF